MRITAAQRAANENRIRAAMDRLLRGEIPPGRCDITTLVVEAGVNRTAFYGTRPHADLRAEFERRLRTLQQAGDQPDPRDAQITRLKTEIHRAEEPFGRVNQHDQPTHRVPDPGPRATRRSTRRDHPSAGRRHLRQPSQPTSATGSDHRLMQLTERPGRQRSGVGVRTREGSAKIRRKKATSDLELNLPQVRCLGRIGVGCPTRDSDAQTQPEARSCVTVRSGLLRVPAQIGQRRTR